MAYNVGYLVVYTAHQILQTMGLNLFYILFKREGRQLHFL
jgi:hypothetical protein